VSDFMSRASLAGAVDLSSLRKPEPTVQGSTPQVAADLLTMPSLIAQGNETNLRNFIELSNQVPVIIEFYAGWSEQSKDLSPKLIKLVGEFEGRVVLLQFDLDSNVNVARAFKVGTAPTVLALLRGQPVPLFDGDQPDENLKVVFDRVLEIAAENGIDQKVSVEMPTGQVPPPALPPKHQAAFDAIDAGDYAEAVRQYEQAIADNPGDTLAIAGLAQAKLLVRTDGIDFEKILASAPETVDDVLIKADACFAVGHPAQAFSTILTKFAVTFGDEREMLRKHLLELFLICPPDQPELADARRQLAALLY
jgi:putative thioredoxin